MFDIFFHSRLMISLILFLLLLVIVSLKFTFRIVQKAGFSKWYAVFCLVPGVNLIAIWIFSFIEWPAEIDKNCRNV